MSQNLQNLAPLKNAAQKPKIKELGQVFTPKFVVDLMLENVSLLGRKILEPGCGEGAFLTQIVRKYIKEFLAKNSKQNLNSNSSQNLDEIPNFKSNSSQNLSEIPNFKSNLKSNSSSNLGENLNLKSQILRLDKNASKALKNELESKIIGIEIDSEILLKCKENLDKIAAEFGLKNIKWNLRSGDFLTLWREYAEQIDLIIGNPPYVRVHNLGANARKFTRGGMGDLYLIFFELGLKCLKNGGELIFITPSSWLNSKAGASFRSQISHTQNLFKIIDFSHEKIFDKITTYSAISFFKKGVKCGKIELCDYKNKSSEVIFYEDLFLKNGEIFLGRSEFKKILALQPLPVKNGFATLCDEFFIGDFKGLKYPKIRVLKASNGKFFECIFPYENGVFKRPKGEVLRRYEAFEMRLKKRDLRGAFWMEFGRTQGVRDVIFRKIAFNTLVREIKDLKIFELNAGEGVFSGLYLVSDLPLKSFEKALKTAEFLDFVKSLRKYKNGGYYSFSSADLGRFLAFKFENLNAVSRTKICEILTQ